MPILEKVWKLIIAVIFCLSRHGMRHLMTPCFKRGLFWTKRQKVLFWKRGCLVTLLDLLGSLLKKFWVLNTIPLLLTTPDQRFFNYEPTGCQLFTHHRFAWSYEKILSTLERLETSIVIFRAKSATRMTYLLSFSHQVNMNSLLIIKKRT